MSILSNVQLNDKRFDNLCSLIKINYPNSCVLWIDEVINDELLSKYMQTKEDIFKKRGFLTEKQVFHGTKESNIKEIVNNGFDSLKNKNSVFGKGTYFAEYANYSKNYSDISSDDLSFMFICDILIGKCCIGCVNMVINETKYDCAVDNLNNPNIYVIPNNNAAYPKYIIAFHKNAK